MGNKLSTEDHIFRLKLKTKELVKYITLQNCKKKKCTPN